MNTYFKSPAPAIGPAAISWLLALAAFCIAAQPALGAQANNRASSCDGLMRAWTEAPVGSVASDVLLTKIIERCDPADTDGDGLFDFIEEIVHGTDPLNPDTDSDALLDGWEVNGHPNGTPLPGADPLHADIYVEMDYMVRETATNGLGPNATVLAEIVTVFANAPIDNPDGTTGINIHLELDEEVPYVDNLYPVFSAFDLLRDSYFSELRRPVYHYMIWANAYNFGSSSGISFGIPAPDFIVSLGRWNAGAGGTDEQKIGTFIHEIGHNLGLRHGGNDHTNYKPNYLSVMSYTFQVVGVPGPNGPVFDYQRFDLPPLNEAALSEPNGLNAGPEWAGYRAVYYCAGSFTRVETDLAPIDWDCDNDTSAVVSGSVNRDPYIEELGTQNNWANIVFDGGGLIGSGIGLRHQLFRIAEPMEEELSWEQFMERN